MTPTAKRPLGRDPGAPPMLIDAGGGARLHLTMALGDYDHLRDLASGRIRLEGIALNAFTLPVEEIFYRFVNHQEWDVSEVSFCKYVALRSTDAAPMVAIPVFPSRVFRHSSIYVRSDRGIAAPQDLKGRKVGIPEWGQTAGVWVRGMLAEQYDVPLDTVEWLQAGVDAPGRGEKVPLDLPDGIRYTPRPETTLSALLEAGEVDAVISARPPSIFAHGGGLVRRLFEDHREEERRYFGETGLFPIMHTIAIRRGVFEAQPWVAMTLMKAFEAAKAASLERLSDYTASRLPIPFASSLVADARAGFSGDPFAYGVEPNRTALEAFCRYLDAQGLTRRAMTPEELFPLEVQSRVTV